MPDFVGTYQLTGDLPEKWREELSTVASSMDLKIRSAYLVGNRKLTVKIHISKNVPIPTNELASSFFADATQTLSGGQIGTGRTQLISIAPTSTLIDLIRNDFRVAITSMALALGLWHLAPAIFNHLFKTNNILTTFDIFQTALVVIAITATTVTFLFDKRTQQRELAAETEKNLQAVQEQTLIQQASVTEDPKTQARLELARVTLRIRTSRMRGDADRLWDRSLWTYRGAVLFYCLALAGPGAAVLLLLKSVTPDWHFMFGGLSLAAVQLAIGTALLRHDTKLREQHQETARDVMALERYELALNYARITSSEIYQSTMQQVISQLLSGRIGDPMQFPTSRDKSEETESTSGVQKLVDEAMDKSKEVIATIVPTKRS